MFRLVRQYFLRKPLPPLTYQGWGAVQTFIIIGDLLYDNQMALALSEALVKEGKSPVMMMYQNSKKPKDYVPEGVYFNNEVNLIGKPKRHVIDALKTKYDVLIDLSPSRKLPNDFLVQQLQTQLRIAVGHDEKNYHFMVNAANKPDLCTAEILKYLKIINT